VVLTIRDDGVGFVDSPALSKGMGLQIMRYRAAMVGGTISIASNEGGGTVITCQSKTIH
jgi:signal transduction histidine kinase